MIDFIYKPKGTRIWRWKFRLHPDDVKVEDVSLGTSDKQVAERKRTVWLREKEHERAGVIPPKTAREAANRSLSEHLDDFLGDMRRRGKSEKYLSNLEYRVGKLIVDCGWKIASDVTADSFQTWRRSQEMAAKTINDYLESVRCLFNWLVRHGRMGSNPLCSLEKVERHGEDEYRRAFSEDEIQRLLAASGERKPVYLMTVHTGLRRSELASLNWFDLFLDAELPYVHVRASTTKNGKAVQMRLHPEVVQVLRELKSKAVQTQQAVFPRFPRIERFRRDLKKAGISYEDEQGRVGDFHSLRKTFGTNLAKAGAPSRVAMALMRHSDRRLTDKIYTDENLLGTASAIDLLPTYTESPHK